MTIEGQGPVVKDKKQKFSESRFGKSLTVLTLGSSLLAGCAGLERHSEFPEVPNIPSRRYIYGDNRELIAGYELLFSKGSVAQYTEFYGSVVPFENDLKYLYDTQQSYMKEHRSNGPLVNLFVDQDQINKEYFLKKYGFFIEKGQVGANGLTPVNMRVVSKTTPANSNVILSYDDIPLIIKNYGEPNQEIFVNFKSGLKKCSALKIAEGESIELEFKESDSFIKYSYTMRRDNTIGYVTFEKGDLRGYRKHVNDYFYNNTGGSLVRTEANIDPKTLRDDALKIFQNLSPNATPVFSTSYHGSVNHNRGVGDIPSWIDIIAESASKCQYHKPVIVMIGNCYDGITAEIVEQMAKLPQGSIIVTSNDFKATSSDCRYIMLNNNTPLVETMLSYSSFYLKSDPNNQNIMLAVVTTDGVKVFSEENCINFDEKTADKGIHVPELCDKGIISKNKEELIAILRKDKEHDYSACFPYLDDEQFRFVLSGMVFAAENSLMGKIR